MKVKMRLSFILNEIVVLKSEKTSVSVLLNTEVKFNVISQHFTVINEIIHINIKLLYFILLNNWYRYYYNAYLMKYYLKNN